MEEQKSKEVKMGAEATEQKFTYEQLEKLCNRLYQENQSYKKFVNTVDRLDYLLRIMEIGNKQGVWNFSDGFMNSCIKEIEDIMALPKKDSNDN